MQRLGRKHRCLGCHPCAESVHTQRETGEVAENAVEGGRGSPQATLGAQSDPNPA